MNIHFWITMGGSAAVVFPLAAVLQRGKRLDAVQRRLGWVCLAAFLAEVINYTLISLGSSNSRVINVYILVEFLLLLAVFKAALQEFVSPRTYLFLGMAFLAFAIGEITYKGTWATLLVNTLLVSEVVLVIFSMLYFIKSLKVQEAHGRMEKDPAFWMAMGVLLYFSGSIVLFALRSYLSPDTARQSSIVRLHLHTFLNFLHYILFGIALWTRPKTST